MRMVLLLLLNSFLLNSYLVSQTKNYYDDIIEFVGLISHDYELIVFHFDKINNCVIENNPNSLIESEVLVSESHNSNTRTFMESISIIDVNGLLKKRESKIWWGYDSTNSFNNMKWAYEYERNALTQEIWYVEDLDSFDNKRNYKNEQILWKPNSRKVISRDSLGRIILKTIYDSNSEINHTSKFAYTNDKEIEEYYDSILDDNIRIVREKNKSGDIIIESTYIIKNDSLLPQYQREYFYTVDNKKEKESFIRWSLSKGTITEKYLKTYIYNDKDRLSEIETVTEHLGSTENHVYTDTTKFEYDTNGYLSKLDQGIDIFVFNNNKQGFIENFLWQVVLKNDTKNILTINQSIKKQ